MAKIPFDIKYRPQIESGEYKVETRDGRAARITCWDLKHGYYVIVAALQEGCDECSVELYTDKGFYWAGDSQSGYDLFLITPEPELSEFEMATLKAFDKMCADEKHMTPRTNHIKEAAAELLKLALEEQKPADRVFTFDDVLALCSASAMAMGQGDKKLYGALKSIFERVYDAYYGGQKPAEWSEEDEKKRKGLIEGLEKRMGFGWASDPFSREEYIDWLKSLPERFNLQPKQEWSEEDVKMIERLIRHTQKEYDELCKDRYGHQEIISDLKESCRERMNWLENRLKSLCPQPHWKPSDGQMDALRMQCDALDKAWKDPDRRVSLKIDVLKTLYDDLKKLM